MAYSSTDGRFQDSSSIKLSCSFDFELGRGGEEGVVCDDDGDD